VGGGSFAVSARSRGRGVPERRVVGGDSLTRGSRLLYKGVVVGGEGRQPGGEGAQPPERVLGPRLRF